MTKWKPRELLAIAAKRAPLAFVSGRTLPHDADNNCRTSHPNNPHCWCGGCLAQGALEGLDAAGFPSDWQKDVEACMRAHGQTVKLRPELPSDDVTALRIRLVEEEAAELVAALRRGDLVGIADNVADLVYVAVGTAAACGVRLSPVFDAVHAANMAKVGGPKRDDGKFMRPPGWQPADVAGVLARQPEGG